MNILVTGGAGFIGRWVVKNLLSRDVDVWVLDDLSNGQESNLDEFVHINQGQGMTVPETDDK